MEDTLALIVVTLTVAIMAYIVYRFVKKNKQAEKEYQERQAKAYEQLAEMNRETTRKLKAEDAVRVALRRHSNHNSPQFNPKNPDVLLPKKTSLTAVPQPVSTTPVNNWSDDLLTTMIISDMLTNHKGLSASPMSWMGETPTVTETYSKPSFGMDDDDSRKSAVSSFSSSDSSSSWSDSSSSSSDSGPSSDW